jgi:hypothetical protein
MTAYPGYLALQYIAETGLQAISSTMIINVSLIAAGQDHLGSGCGRSLTQESWPSSSRQSKQSSF